MKTIVWETNFNGKMACDRFPHVDFAPGKLPSSDELDKSVFQIKTADSSHPPVMVKIEHIIPFKLTELSNIHTWPSHGMDTSEFIEMQHRKKVTNRETLFAVYYYRRVSVN